MARSLQVSFPKAVSEGLQGLVRADSCDGSGRILEFLEPSLNREAGVG